jgi:predicted P-loop ATPase
MRHSGRDDPDVINLKKEKVRRGKWQNDAIKSDNGKLLPNIANALLALRRDSGIQDAFAYDEMQRTTMLMHPIGSPMAPFEPRAIIDEDVAYAAEHLQQAGLKHISVGVVRDAIGARALENCYHPVRDYLDSLQWDGRSRIDFWLRLGAEHNPYTSAVGRMFLIRWWRGFMSRAARRITCWFGKAHRACSSRRPAPCLAVRGFRMRCRTSVAAKMRPNICVANG